MRPIPNIWHHGFTAFTTTTDKHGYVFCKQCPTLMNKKMNLTVLILAQCLIHRRLNLFLYLQRQTLVTPCWYCQIKTMNWHVTVTQVQVNSEIYIENNTFYGTDTIQYNTIKTLVLRSLKYERECIMESLTNLKPIAR